MAMTEAMARAIIANPKKYGPQKVGEAKAFLGMARPSKKARKTIAQQQALRLARGKKIGKAKYMHFARP